MLLFLMAIAIYHVISYLDGLFYSFININTGNVEDNINEALNLNYNRNKTPKEPLIKNW